MSVEANALLLESNCFLMVFLQSVIHVNQKTRKKISNVEQPLINLKLLISETKCLLEGIHRLLILPHERFFISKYQESMYLVYFVIKEKYKLQAKVKCDFKNG